MGLIDTLRRWNAVNRSPLLSRADPPLAFDQWVSWFNFSGNVYNSAINQTMPGNRQEDIDSLTGIVQHAYKGNGVVFACMLVRALLFSEARFQFQAMVKGRPGELFGTPELRIIEAPGPNQTTGDLLTRMIQDADIYGNWFGVRRPSRIKRLNPEWVTILMGSDRDPDVTGVDIDAEVVGYIYHPGGRHSGREPEFLLPEVVAHWAPVPDPSATFRGMSWITPIAREVMGDSAARDHKLAFFENSATPNMVVSLDPTIALQEYNDWIDKFEEPKGLDAYKTMYLGAGAKVEVVGRDLQQLDFKMVQGAGETRIAAAAGVPPIIVGLSEGLQAATYSNYGQARRRFADGTMRPLWRGAAAALASIIDVPAGSRLWYDDRDIPFLQEDVKDAADIIAVNATAISSFVTSGYTPDSAVDAVNSGDLARLIHTGLFSVQLQPPMPEGPPEPQILEKPEPKLLEAPRSEVLDGEFGWTQPVLNIYNNLPEGFVRAETVIHNEAPVTNIHEGAVQVPVTVERSDVNITEGAIRVEAPPPAEVTVHVAPAEAPVVNITESAITVEAPPPAEVTVNIEPAEPPVVNVNVPEAKPVTRSVERNPAGQITRVTETTD